MLAILCSEPQSPSSPGSLEGAVGFSSRTNMKRRGTHVTRLSRSINRVWLMFSSFFSIFFGGRSGRDTGPANEKVGAGPLGHVPGDDVDFEKQAWKMLRYMHVSFGATSWLEQSESSQNPCRKFRKLLPERVVCSFLLVYSLGITRTLVLWFL